ncbi:hypothetical protein L6164_006283 [Bauhinia variegata]|uniref:Uncharacterized protein n=1 Tax=Bauhinia variegata TaxID=167791 RepID=A0ACB9PTG2_BAUVA|nr:hypothetical protein L6164_006283 [Bauhinia variegata]
MHELLQDMAKEIIRNESPREPGQRSRIWFHEDVLHILNENTGTDNIEGIKIDLPEPEKVVDLAKALAKMKKLRLLMVYNAHISDEIHYLSDELSCCEFLTEIPDFSMVPNLESLNLDNCTNLFKESHCEAAFPGGEVPDWFDYHSTNSSISLEVASRLCGKPVDCFFGAVVELDKAAKATDSSVKAGKGYKTGSDALHCLHFLVYTKPFTFSYCGCRSLKL